MPACTSLKASLSAPEFLADSEGKRIRAIMRRENRFFDKGLYKTIQKYWGMSPGRLYRAESVTELAIIQKQI